MSNTRRLPVPADAEAFRDSVLRHVRYSLGREWGKLPPRQLFEAVSLAVRDRIVDLMIESKARFRNAGDKRVYYLSMEFLMGRSLGNNLHNLGLYELCQEALLEMGVDIEEVVESEGDAALGNGGLGRLAACFLDSLASLDMPGYGFGINYEYGLFRQEIDNGWQKEKPDGWRALGTPWQFERPDHSVVVPLYGRLDGLEGLDGIQDSIWSDWDVLVGMPHDMPVVGYGGRTVNVLRLYSARASDEFDMSIFNGGDYLEAVRRKMESETVSKVLYPPDNDEKGRELRLIQEYFFTSCAVQSIVADYVAESGDLAGFADKVAIHLNDTHPALAVAELMRVLMDEHGLEWDAAWPITRDTLAYTNHTLLPEALERWPRRLIRRVIPRHLQIIEMIDAQFVAEVRERFPGDEARVERMGIVDRSGAEPELRMAHLAIVGCHSVNGVAELHSELLREQLVPDFHEMWPRRFNNKTNGITQRRWLHQCNPGLRDLIDETIGPGWVMQLEQLRELEPFADDASFRERFTAVKQANKRRLADTITRLVRVDVDPTSMFDVQAKRIHEYKRQLLLALNAVHCYLRIVEDGITPVTPRTIVFAGKAAPGYWVAKQQIKLFNNIARVINTESRCDGLLRVVFIPDYRVSLAEQIMPAANLSEQISTAGMEASGTGNMKFALNGALTIGTLDGANIEIRDEVGEENIFIFGLRAEEIAAHREQGSYDSRAVYEADPQLRRALDAIDSERFSGCDPRLFHWLKNSLLDGGDPFFNLADFAAYNATHELVAHEYQDAEAWTRKAILNVARMGKFSSDRTVREYAREIWGLLPASTQEPAPVPTARVP